MPRRRPALVLFALVAVPGLAGAADRPIELAADLTDAPRKLYKARLVIPAKPGPLTLYYPKWIPGEHQPSGPINDLSGLKLTAGGKPVRWTRDDVDLYAFHLTVPEGADAVEASLEYLMPGEKGGYGAGISATAKLAILNWFLVTLYPQGQPVRGLMVRASLTVPDGWKAGTALPVESRDGNTTRFQTVSLEMLADSPVLCGQHFREVPIGPKSGPPHFLVLACDSAAGLGIEPKTVEQYGRLVEEAGALFGSRHYRSYRFLVCLSDQITENAIEHHESSDNRMPERMFVDDTYRKLAPMWVLPHEYVHSWNGKYRRPAGLATPDFQKPHRTRLLWVYEGLTEYYGYVLAARSGLYAPDVFRENLAMVADWARNQGGRSWRPLEDTAAAAPHLYAARNDWSRRRRGVDFYDEGALLWLDADTLIREKTGGKKSLDDFARSFYGGDGGAPAVVPYTFEDVVAALNGVVEHDWKGFLEERLRATSPEPPLAGVTRGGWKATYGTSRGEVLKALEDEEKLIDLTASIGLLLKDDGKIADVVPGSPADRAKLGPHMKVVAVNGRRLSADRLREAVAATAGGKGKLDLLVENGEEFATYPLDYAGGARFPQLEREAGSPDRLGEIIRPRAGGK